MSVATWYLILAKSWVLWCVHRRGFRSLQAFWGAADSEAALKAMGADSRGDPFRSLAGAALDMARTEATAKRPSGLAERVSRGLRRSARRSMAGLESGLGVLASVSATAPFIGLFGTVWGIYHALVGIGFTGQATIDKVAGPVGEALVMTAFGLAVAIPAVLAYNFAVRANRDIAAELDAFAQELHARVLEAAGVADAGRS
ncbi:MAG: MotA/TolQ/ExbB proton channel family protein [Burkholderiales bacterium]|nr:MotA/TolQ/ExbB proton channel family protein [Burkholderiales bacterium]